MNFLTVFLTILKVLGIVIGVIVILAVCIVLFLRFGSIKYRATVAYDQNEPLIRIKLTLLYPVLWAYLNYENGEFDYDARFFHLSYFYDDIKEKKKRKKKKKKKKQRLPEEKRSIIDDAIEGIKGSKSEAQSPLQEEARQLPQRKRPVKKRKKSILRRIKDFWEDLRQKIDVLLHYAKDILMLFRDPDNREAVLFVLKTLKSIFRYIFEHKHKVYIKYGNEDPAKTAQWYGTFCAVAYMLGINLQTELDFEHDAFALDASFRGYVKIYIVVKWVLDLYKNDKLVDLIGKLS